MEIKILVTGVEGYIGSMVYQQLELMGRYSFMNPDSSHNITVQPLFFLDQKSIASFINENFDFIFHCAVVGGRNYDINSEFTYDQNIELFNLVKSLKCDKIIHFTSAADLGINNNINNANPNLVLDANPNDNFGKAKNVISKEIILNKLGINIRIFNIYGRFVNNSTNFIDSLIDSCLLNKDIIINADRYFDFFYIENLRTILVKIINQEIITDYNLVHNKKYKISELVYFISNYLKSESLISITKSEKNYTGSNSIEISSIDLIDPVTDLKEYINLRKSGLFKNQS